MLLSQPPDLQQDDREILRGSWLRQQLLGNRFQLNYQVYDITNYLLANARFLFPDKNEIDVVIGRETKDFGDARPISTTKCTKPFYATLIAYNSSTGGYDILARSTPKPNTLDRSSREDAMIALLSLIEPLVYKRLKERNEQRTEVDELIKAQEV